MFVAFMFQVVPSFLVMWSCHSLLGRQLDLFPLLWCEGVSFCLCLSVSASRQTTPRFNKTTTTQQQQQQQQTNKQTKIMDQYVFPTMTYGCQTWSFNKQLTNKQRRAQRAMERNIYVKLQDKIAFQFCWHLL